ncbi:hypothetical protein pb186bvf_015479 [Paramecium bursaria]
MGIIQNRSVSYVFRFINLDETQLCLQTITIDEYLSNTQILKQLEADTLLKLIKRDFQNLPKNHACKQQMLLINSLEELFMKYYQPYIQMNSWKNSSRLNNQIKELLLICYLVMRDMRQNVQPWWTPVLLQQIFKNKSNDSEEFSLLIQIQYLKQQILSRCPWLEGKQDNYYSKEAEKIQTLKIMYSLY